MTKQDEFKSVVNAYREEFNDNNVEVIFPLAWESEVEVENDTKIKISFMETDIIIVKGMNDYNWSIPAGLLGVS